MKIGDILQAKRLEKKLTVEAVRAATKIQTAYIEALEADNPAAFAAPMYYKAFLRSYAKFLGLDDNALIKKYDDSQRIEEDKKEFIESPAPLKYDNSKLLISIILFLVMLAGFIYLSSAVSAERFAEPAETEAYDVIETEEIILIEPEEQETETPEEAPEPEPAPAPEPVKKPLVKKPVKRKAVVPPATRDTFLDAAPDRQALAVIAAAETEIELIADGKKVFKGTIPAGGRQKWFAENGFVLKLDNAQNAKVYFDGKKVDTAKYGSETAKIFLNKDIMPK